MASQEERNRLVQSFGLVFALVDYRLTAVFLRCLFVSVAFRMYSMMSGRQMYAPVVTTSTHVAKYGSQGTVDASQGYSCSSTFMECSVLPYGIDGMCDGGF